MILCRIPGRLVAPARVRMLSSAYSSRAWPRMMRGWKRSAPLSRRCLSDVPDRQTANGQPLGSRGPQPEEVIMEIIVALVIVIAAVLAFSAMRWITRGKSEDPTRKP